MSEEEIREALAHLATLGDFLRWAETQLRKHDVFLGHGTDNYNDEALALVLHALHLPWQVNPRVYSARLLPSEKKAIAELLKRRINERVPTAYLTNEAWFCGLPFYIDERVLIPRSPLGQLIEQRFEPWLTDATSPLRALDLCTGSGCIAIAMAHALPNSTVDAIDISADALAVCEINVAQHGLADRVFPLLGDGLSIAQERYHLIVCNPPYVDADEMANLPNEYIHEPELALASGRDGLDFTRRLLAESADYLTKDGILIVEVGYSWPAVKSLWPEVPFFWFEFEQGGEGAFMLTYQELVEYSSVFKETLLSV